MFRIFCYDTDYEMGQRPCGLIELEELTGRHVSYLLKDFSGGVGTQRLVFAHVGIDGVSEGFAEYTISHVNGVTLKEWTMYMGKKLVSNRKGDC